jgi:uncharacterized protein YdhG (YjbR/CyaY superfamily)
MVTTPKSGFINVDEYIASQPEPMRVSLESLRQTIRKAVPEAEESISYQMPSFRFHGMLIWYAVFKAHYGIYVRHEVLLKFKDKLSGYKLSKSSITIPFGKPIPEKLIAEIVSYSVTVNLGRKLLKETTKRKKTTH